jgi:exopolysaccharide biosynthesis polyprenyl glycosylphosphotransferase
MKTTTHYRTYIISDFVLSALAWFIFFFFRRAVLDDIPTPGMPVFAPDNNLYIGVTVLPFFWITVFYLSGYYRNVVRKSRFTEFAQTFMSVLLGSIFLFFALLLDDVVKGYSTYYISFLSLFGIEFAFIYFARSILRYFTIRAIHSGKNGFKTIIIGSTENIENVLTQLPHTLGNILMGVVTIKDKKKPHATHGLNWLGNEQGLEKTIVEHNIEEVILATENISFDEIKGLLAILYRHDVYIKATPGVAEKLIGTAKLNPIYGTPFMEVAHELMPPFEENLKRVFDVIISFVLLTVLSPIYFYLALRVTFDSKGPVFYTQTRIGKGGKPFKIIKFRTMIRDAEHNETPQLTLPDDNRITSFGKFMRKYRLDELPQFWNVIKGDMALVGPRPERPYFIDKITETEPNYYLLLKVRPGITSLGMVKYGYADSPKKMVERMKYDLIYLENMSLIYDLKIFFYTLKTIITGKGV